MNEENKNEQNPTPENGGDKLFAYIAIGLIAAGAVALGVSFTVLGIYALIASICLEFAAMTLVNLQKRKYDFSWLKYIKLAAYIVFSAAIAVLVFSSIL